MKLSRGCQRPPRTSEGRRGCHRATSCLQRQQHLVKLRGPNCFGLACAHGLYDSPRLSRRPLTIKGPYGLEGAVVSRHPAVGTKETCSKTRGGPVQMVRCIARQSRFYQLQCKSRNSEPMESVFVSVAWSCAAAWARSSMARRQGSRE